MKLLNGVRLGERFGILSEPNVKPPSQVKPLSQ